MILLAQGLIINTELGLQLSYTDPQWAQRNKEG